MWDVLKVIGFCSVMALAMWGFATEEPDGPDDMWTLSMDGRTYHCERTNDNVTCKEQHQ